MTLARLLALRQHKAHRLRRQWVCLRQIYEQQEQQLVDLRHQRQQLCHRLQHIADWRGKLHPAEADEQRALQHEVYQTERELQKCICELVARHQQQHTAIESQQVLIRINQREQEKLRMLIKNETNRY